MTTIKLKPEEVILYEGTVTCNVFKGIVCLTLTSSKIVFEQEKGIFKKSRETLESINLLNIKFYNNEPQVKQKGLSVDIQTAEKNLSISFPGMMEARKFSNKLIDAVTGTTFAKRSSNKIKDAFNLVDDTLGLDTRSAIKGVIENGVMDTLFNGIKKSKK